MRWGGVGAQSRGPESDAKSPPGSFLQRAHEGGCHLWPLWVFVLSWLWGGAGWCQGSWAAAATAQANELMSSLGV